MNARPVSLFIVFLFFFFQGLSQAKVGGGISTPLQSKTLQKADKQFFIENKGQWPFEVLYLTQSPGLNTWITRKGMWFEYYKIEEIEPLGSKSNEKFSRLEKFETVETRRSGHRVGYTLVGNNQNVQTEPNGKQECYYNYLLGNDPSKHASYVGLYKEVKVNEVYKGIGMRYYFEKGNLRYDFIVEPGADPNQIQFRFEGSEKSYLNANGELVFTTSFGEVKNADLFCYQLLNNGTSLKSVTAKFDRRQENWVINLGDYDNEQTLIIDPLIYSTYMGGNSIDEGRSIVLDTFKNAYITGTTHSLNYDVTAGAFQTLFAGNSDVFVSKLNAKW
ncbi:MAG: SBBP repeat-containing protein [Bacteroidetes bacterium]|nr:SBBP repeat-containing protein [Bacteroidota bacterium]